MSETTEPTSVGDLIASELNEKMDKLLINIGGIERKLGRKDVPEDVKNLLRFNLKKVCAAMQVCQEQLEDFSRI
jgi:hypothetical protein